MRASFNTVSPAQPPEQLPIRLEQSTARASIVLRLLMLLPALVTLAVPLTLLAAHAAAEPAPLEFLTDHPLASAQIGLAAILWAVLFVGPLQRILARAGTRREVEITAERVSVIERGPIRARTWSLPLSDYRGVAHHVRTGLSGVRHEMILVHPDPARHVLLAVNDTISANALARAAKLLSLPEVPARELYGRESVVPRDRSSPGQLLPVRS